MWTIGAYDAIGTPTGREITGYGGTTAVHGIPLFGAEDISSDLAGTNFDGAVTIGADALGKISGTKGLSVDVDDSLKPIQTGAGLLGYQYAIESSIELGGNLVPNEIEFNGEAGVSHSEIWLRKQIPWWPFR